MARMRTLCVILHPVCCPPLDQSIPQTEQYSMKCLVWKRLPLYNVPHSCKPRCLLFWQYAWAHTSSDTDDVSEEYRLDAATLMEHFLLWETIFIKNLYPPFCLTVCAKVSSQSTTHPHSVPWFTACYFPLRGFPMCTRTQLLDFSPFKINPRYFF